MKRLALLLVVASPAAFARPWNAVEPGVTPKDEVLKRFGEPSKVVSPNENLEILAYLKDKAIRGTTQTQFKVDVKSRIVQRIDVFPSAVIDRDAVENTYGKPCPVGPLPEAPCYLKKVTDDFRVYFHYPRIGLAVFFNADGGTVNSLIFEPQKHKDAVKVAEPQANQSP